MSELISLADAAPAAPAPAPCPFGDSQDGGRHSWEGVGVISVNIGSTINPQAVPAIAQSCACGAVRAVAVASIQGQP